MFVIHIVTDTTVVKNLLSYTIIYKVAIGVVGLMENGCTFLINADLLFGVVS